MIPVETHADAFVNATALIGLICALFSLPAARNASMLDQRLKGLYAWIALLLGARQLFWFTPSSWLVFVIMAVAAWMPLFILLLVEEVLRRHAPRYLKYLALVCGASFTAVAVGAGPDWSRSALTAFATTMSIVLTLIVLFIAQSRRRELSATETCLADSVALALVLCVPASISEFHGLWPQLPVALGMPALLLFIVMSAALATGIGTPLRFLLDVAALLLTATTIALSTHWLVPTLATPDLVRLGTNVLCVSAVVLILYRLNESRRLSLRRRTVVDALAVLPEDADADAMIAAHPLTAAGVILDEHQLSLYGADIRAALAGQAVVTRATFTDADATSAIRNLLDEHSATHLVRLGRAPLRLLALTSGAVGDTRAIDAELTLLSRFVERSR